MKRCLLVVTGASRGFGRSVCEALVEGGDDNDTVASPAGAVADDGEPFAKIVRCCLIARSEDGLVETQALMEKSASAAKHSHHARSSDDDIKITRHVVDLSDLDSLQEKLSQDVFATLTPPPASDYYDVLLVVQNAGSLGFIGHTLTTETLPLSHSLRDLQKTIDL